MTGQKVNLQEREPCEGCEETGCRQCCYPMPAQQPSLQVEHRFVGIQVRPMHRMDADGTMSRIDRYRWLACECGTIFPSPHFMRAHLRRHGALPHGVYTTLPEGGPE